MIRQDRYSHTLVAGPASSRQVVNSMAGEYTDAEIEFMLAVDRYKREKHRPFPTCNEILAVVLALGYRKLAEAHKNRKDKVI